MLVDLNLEFVMFAVYVNNCLVVGSKEGIQYMKP
jgi:hypothetical protein